MSKTNHLGLDGNTRTTFLTVLEEMSVSLATARLGVTQSAVSHTLNKLREIFDDPLSVTLLDLSVSFRVRDAVRMRTMRQKHVHNCTHPDDYFTQTANTPCE